MDISTINWLAVLLATASSFLIGGVWYSALFAKKWQTLAKVSDKDLKGKSPARAFIGTFILAAVMAVNLELFIGNGDAVFGLFAGFAVGFGWIAMALGTNYLFERRPFQLYAINAGYNVVTLTLMGLIIGLF